MNKTFVALMGVMFASSAFATPVTTDSDTADIQVTVEQYCYVRNVDEAKGGNGQFNITVGGAALESDAAAGADTVVFESFGNFGYELVATLDAPQIAIPADALAELGLPAGTTEAVTWKIAVDGMSLEDVTAFGAANDVVYAGGPTSQRVTPCVIKTVPVQLELSEVGLKAMSTVQNGNATYNGVLTLTLNPKI